MDKGICFYIFTFIEIPDEMIKHVISLSLHYTMETGHL